MPSPLHDLFERRVPQWTAVYLGAGWGLVQFIAFIEQRYLISPHWTDLALLSLGLLLPSVVLYTYNHGRPGADQIQRSEKVGIPANLVIAAVVLWMVFGNKDLGAMTTEVTVTGENGETIERQLAKAEHRRRVALFPIETPAPVDSAWLGHAAELALLFDLSQDPWLDLRTMQHFIERVREVGYAPGQAIPLSLKRQIADRLSLTHFTAGRVEPAAGGLRLTVALYDAERGRLVAERTYTGAALLPLVDSAASGLRRDLDLPAAHLDEVEDLPVVERLTANPVALRAYARAYVEMLHNDWPAATAHLSQAVELDPSFAAAAAGLFQARLYTGDPQGAVRALNVAADHVYRLPERMQFFIRAGQYQMQQQNDRAIGVLEMAAELYPDDVESRTTLAMVLQQAEREREAIGRLEEVLRIDPAQVEQLLAIGTLYRGLGEYDSAIAAFERYVAVKPSDAVGPTRIGEIEALRGNHDAARARYERALLLDPASVDVMLASAAVASDVGDFAEARARIAAAEAASRTAEARFKIADARAELAQWRGRPMETHAELAQSIDHARQFTAPLIVEILRMRALKPLAEAGRADEAARQLEAISAGITGIFADVTAIGALSIEIGRAQPDPARIDAEADRLERFIAANNWEMLRAALMNARGIAAEQRGQYDDAVRFYREQLQLEPAKTAGYVHLGRALRLNGDLTGAARQLTTAIQRRPADARAHYELALVHEAAGRKTEAVASLRRALATWEEAEPAYQPAARARAALDRLLAARPAGG